MTIRRRTAEATADTVGFYSEDIVGRHADERWHGLYAVRVRHDENKPFHVTIYEVDVDEDGTLVDTTDLENYGNQLFYVRNPRDGVTYYPRVESHSQAVNQAATYPSSASVTGEENAIPQVATRHVRVDVQGLTATTGTAEVDVYYQTAGDYRF